MITLLILFFLSLIGISFMIGKKLVLIRNGNVIHQETLPRLIPDLQTLKYTTYKTTKQGVYIATIVALRLYVKSGNLAKNIYNKTKTKIQSLKKKDETTEKKEASKFLKMISDYKYKVKHIKKQIEEENK